MVQSGSSTMGEDVTDVAGKWLEGGETAELVHKETSFSQGSQQSEGTWTWRLKHKESTS